MIKKNSFGSSSTSLPATLVAGEHLAEGHCLLEEQTLNEVKLLIYRAELESQQLQNRRAEFRAKLNLNKEHCLKVIPPIT
jgi:hypothetical protein